MSAKNYMPYIAGAMEHIQRIYEWNDRVDEMRGETNRAYNLNDGLRMYYEEKQEYTDAMLSGDKQEAVDAIIDQFVIAIGEIRKCALSDDYEKIEFWEKKAQEAYWELDTHISNLTIDQFNKLDKDGYSREAHKISEARTEQALTAIIDALFTRFGDDAYIDENGKFIKSECYRKPDLSFLFT